MRSLFAPLTRVCFRLAVGFCMLGLWHSLSETAWAESPLRAIALGDSYTEGVGVSAKDTWPAQVAQSLRSRGVALDEPIVLAGNGWSVQMLIDNKLAKVESLNPDFATVQIGVNDFVRSAGTRKFETRLAHLLDHLQKFLANNRILIVTIPDFSCSPTGKKFGYGIGGGRGVTRYNNVVKKLAGERGLTVVDIFPLSQTLCEDRAMFAEDGLHPSARQYAEWTKIIAPAALHLLQPTRTP